MTKKFLVTFKPVKHRTFTVGAQTEFFAIKKAENQWREESKPVVLSVEEIE